MVKVEKEKGGGKKERTGVKFFSIWIDFANYERILHRHSKIVFDLQAKM